PALGEAEAAADGGVELVGVRRGGVEHDEAGPALPGVPGAGERVPVDAVLAEGCGPLVAEERGGAVDDERSGHEGTPSRRMGRVVSATHQWAGRVPGRWSRCRATSRSSRGRVSRYFVQGTARSVSTGTR